MLAAIAVADRLAQPVERWRPFRPPLALRPWYPRPASWHAATCLTRVSDGSAEAPDPTATVARRASPIDVVASGEPRRRRPQKTAERVAGEIVRDIVARDLGSGAHLPLEAAMAAQYGVSRSSVREALRILEVQGLISLKPGPGGGPVVGVVEATYLARTESLYFHLAGATYRDLIATQAVLEPLCAAAAAANPGRRGGDGAVRRGRGDRRRRPLPP